MGAEKLVAAPRMGRYFGLVAAAGLLASIYIASGSSPAADTRYAQYYPPSPSYGYPPAYHPPCPAVTPGPFRGAARGAAGGALIGAISGNAGRGAAIGAGVGGIAGAVRRGTARAAGACY